MRSSTSFLWLAVALVAAPAQSQDPDAASKPWVSERARWETWLQEAEVVSIEEVGEGVTEPHRVTLTKDGVEFAAIFKPIRRGRHKGYWESYQAEVAAYELDKLIGLDMVPPTIVRRIGPDRGSLQLWVEGCNTYQRVERSVPQNMRFSHQISRMKMFDNLIYNDDRNGGNFLLDESWNVVLIDHSRAFLGREELLEGRGKAPVQYDRDLVERLRSLDEATLERVLGPLLMGGQVSAVLKRRDEILVHLTGLVAERGERAVLFR